MARFRDFIRKQHYLREDEMAPSGGASSPTNPDTAGAGSESNNKTNKYFPDFFGREFGVSDQDFETALESDSITLFGPKIPDFFDFRIQGNVHATVKSLGNDAYDVTFPFKDMYADNPRLFIKPYKQDENPYDWNSPIEDRTVRMTKEQLMDAWQEPFADIANAAGGPPGGMDAGMPPGGF